MPLILLFLPAVLLQCDCANILGIVPSPSFSHQIAYVNLWKELSLKGHKVTVLTTNPIKDPELVNLTEIDLSIGYQFLEEQHNWPTQSIHQKNPIKYVNLMLQMIYEVTDVYLKLPNVQNLIHDKNVRFDIVMVEAIFSEFLVFGEIFNAPTIMLSSLEAAVPLQRIFQNDYHPVVYPETYIPYVGELSFKERLVSMFVNWIFDYIKSQYLSLRQTNLDKYFGNISKPLHVLAEKSCLLFISVSPVLLYPRPMSPRTIIIGGGTTIREPKKPNENIQEFLDSAEQGAIYFSLGSNVRSEHLGDETVNGIIDLFGHLPYSVLWKLEYNGKYKLPRNIMTSDWFPQQDILRHPNLKLFITQGGIQSLEEAIYFEKPMVGIPIFGDQYSNVKKLELKGVLKIVSSKPSIDLVALKTAIMDVISNASFAKNIQRLNKLNLDQPMSGIEKAVWWTEYVIRHRGNMQHMIHSPARTTPFYQYYLLDIFSFMILLSFCILSLCYLIIRSLLRILFCRYASPEHGKKD